MRPSDIVPANIMVALAVQGYVIAKQADIDRDRGKAALFDAMQASGGRRGVYIEVEKGPPAFIVVFDSADQAGEIEARIVNELRDLLTPEVPPVAA